MNLKSLLPAVSIAAALSLPLAAAEKNRASKKNADVEKPAGAPEQKGAHGWLNWRGPTQDGISRETGLPDTVDSAKPLWAIDLPGRVTPVINGNKVYALGYNGEGPDLQQVLRCLDSDTGKTL